MRENIRKAPHFVAVASALVLAFALTACSGTQGSSQAPSSSSADSNAATAAAPKVQSGTVTTTLDMTGYDAGKAVRVWVPVATKGTYQTISKEAVAADGATKSEITEDASGNKMAYIEWGKDVAPKDRKATVSFHATRTEALRPEIVEEGEVPSDIADKYLGSSKMVAADDPDVVALAEEITKDQKTFEGKARAVYDWIYDNMERDNSVVGCGDGDVCRLISEDQRAGKCTDINSVFVALCRAAGVPANEMFGIRMNDADITGNQHCWCEFYVPGTGWVPADPADVLKAVLNDELDKTSQEALDKKEYYWGQWDEKRVEYSQGRDLKLTPAQDGAELNDFGYPYAEVDGKAVDYYKPDAFVYSIAFEQDAKVASAPATMNTPMQKMAADDVLKAVEAKDSSMVVVDLRKAEDYKAGHIAGSVAATFQKAVEDGDYTEGYENIQTALKDADGKTVVLVCYTGNKYAQAATDTLNDLGYDMSKVYTLDGGAQGWSDSGKPMVTD